MGDLIADGACRTLPVMIPNHLHRRISHAEIWRHSGVRLLLRLLLHLAIALQASQLVAQVNDADTLLISSVAALESDAMLPPPDSAAWQELALPSANRLGDEAHIDRVLWLRFAVPKPSTETLHSLYFYRYNLAIDVYFNGQRIGGDSYRPNRQTVAWNHPRLVDIQAANWQADNNIVHVRFVGSYFGGTFAPILFGPQSQLQALYEERSFRQIKVNEWLQASGILVTLLSMSLWIMRRQDPVYLLFAGLTASWLVLQTHMVVYYNLIEYRYWLPLVHIAIDLFILFMFLFLTRFASIPSPRAQRALLCWTTLAILWHVFAPLTYWWMGAYIVHGIGNLFMLFLLARIGMRALRERDLLSVIIGTTVIIQFTLAGHDWLLIMTGDLEDWESAMYLSQFAFPLLLLVFTIGLLNRFVSALNTAEELNRDLEQKVEASRKMIEASFAEQRALEISKAAEEERVKIYRDLHDDVGSKLLSIVHAGRDHKLGELARTALRSLREAVSRANSPQQGLHEFLAALKEESKLRLEGTGHRVDWRESSRLPDLILNPDQVYNLNRICRELVSNVIRHANATNVRFMIDSIAGSQRAESYWRIQIADDGVGIQSEAASGNGLRHIKDRAEGIGCSVSWTNQATAGLLTELLIPVHTTLSIPQVSSPS